MKDIHDILISIILPTYNAEKYIDKCMASIVSQDYSNLEIILVDDGSTDSSPVICDNWAKMDSRVKVIHKKNGGVSSARNTGIDAANGEFISFIDPDDYIEPHLYTEVIKYCDSYDLITFGFYHTDKTSKVCNEADLTTVETHREVMTTIFPEIIGYSASDIKFWNQGNDILKKRFIGYCWLFLFKRSIIKNNNIRFKTDLIKQEDEEFVLNYLIYTNSMKVIKRPYYNYVFHGESVTHTFANKKELEKKYILLKYKNMIRDKILEKDHIDILELYAGSNTLSILQVASISVADKLGYQPIRKYLEMPNIKKSVSMIRLEFKNLKFNCALLLMKMHLYYLVYLIVKGLSLFHIQFGLKT